MWPRDAYVGQHVVAIRSLSDPETGERLERGKVYTIREIMVHDFVATEGVVYFALREIVSNIVRYDAVRPVDESRLDVFREMLKNAHNKNLDRLDA